MFHTTKSGKKIPISSLTTEHLHNIVILMERLAKRGISDSRDKDLPKNAAPHDLIYGEEALKLMNYEAYKNELSGRF